MIKQCSFSMAYFFLSLLSLGLQAQQTPDQASRIDTYLQEAHRLGKLNGNVLIVKNGRTLYKKSFGFADGAHKLALNQDYRFGIGSIYKEFPAVAIMQLKEKGLLKLTDPLSKFLPKLPSWANDIQIEHLLQYTAGLPRVRWRAHQNINEQNIHTDLENLKALSFTPGSDYLYSNNCPILLMKIVAAVTQEPFSTYAQKNLFTPHGLKDLVIKKQFPYLDRHLMAVPFNGEGEEDAFRMRVSSLLFSATTADMVNWLQALHSYKLISKEAVFYLAQTTAVKGENHQAPLGQAILKNDAMIEHSHHGSSGNYEALVRHFPEEKVSMVILTNRKQGNVYKLTEDIHRMLN